MKSDERPLQFVRVLWLAVTLALAAAFSYVLMELNVLQTGDLLPSEKPSGIIYVAAGGYLLGGLLILLRKRWLWLVGLVVNGLVVLVFVNFYAARPSVLFSAGGMVSKAAQLLLEAALIYLILYDWRRSRQRPLAERIS